MDQEPRRLLCGALANIGKVHLTNSLSFLAEDQIEGDAERTARRAVDIVTERTDGFGVSAVLNRDRERDGARDGWGPDCLDLPTLDVVQRDPPKRPCAHASASPQRYKGQGPYFRYGGPPPREAFVARVFAAVGKPDAVSATAVASRRNRELGLSGIGENIASP